MDQWSIFCVRAVVPISNGNFSEFAPDTWNIGGEDLPNYECFHVRRKLFPFLHFQISEVVQYFRDKAGDLLIL
jgi:hypothetical protein